MPEKEYIEREAVVERATYMFDEVLGTCKCVLVEDIEKVPTADVAEVVRCKDCKHGYSYYGNILCTNINSPWYNAEFDIIMENNDFCSYGERKEK